MNIIVSFMSCYMAPCMRYVPIIRRQGPFLVSTGPLRYHNAQNIPYIPYRILEMIAQNALEPTHAKKYAWRMPVSRGEFNTSPTQVA